jgi:hypothetical protein
MRKVKVIKSKYRSYDYDNDETIFYPVSGDWEEVDDKKYAEIVEAVQYANSKVRDDWYFLVEYSETTMDEVFQSATAFKEEMRKKQEKEEKRKEAERKKRQEKALERKKKQLERLKKEFGEE